MTVGPAALTATSTPFGMRFGVDRTNIFNTGRENLYA